MFSKWILATETSSHGCWTQASAASPVGLLSSLKSHIKKYKGMTFSLSLLVIEAITLQYQRTETFGLRKKTAECGKHRRKNGWTSIECTIELAQTDSRTLVCLIGQITNNLSYLFCLSRPGNLQHFSDSSVPHPWPWLWLRPWLNNPWNAKCHIFIILTTGINTQMLATPECHVCKYIHIYTNT